MNEKFEVGEVAIFVRIGLGPFALEDGEEVEIVSPLRKYTKAGSRYDGALVYEIQTRIGLKRSIPDWLRKKRPPRDDLQIVRWADCPWQPHKVTT